jgi:uncharacterized protein (TIGR00252 family)
VATRDIGNAGEDLACSYLLQHAFLVLDRNWRTRYCEIDIIARKAKTMYFVEVKTRKNDHYGSGFDYITVKKLQQMQFAAAMWQSQHNWQGDITLAAVSVNNASQTVEFIEVQ